MNCNIGTDCTKKAQWVTRYKWTEAPELAGCTDCSKAHNGAWQSENFEVRPMLIIDEHCLEQAEPDTRMIQQAILQLMEDCITDNPTSEQVFKSLAQVYLVAGGEKKKLPLLFKGRFNAE